MKLRLFLDEDVHAALAIALRNRGQDAIHALDARRLGLPDESQLSFATAHDRALVTFNVGDFVRLHNRWVTEGREQVIAIIEATRLQIRSTA
jgi:hypothetical protein